MNKILVAVGLLLILRVDNAIAQNTFPSSGNVGINTTSPAVPFEVIGESQFYGPVTAFHQVDGSPTSTVQGSININVAAGLGGQRSRLLTGLDRNYIDTVMENGGAGDFVFGSAYGGAGDVLFLNTANGNVGIGTIAPSAKLEVSGSAVVDGNLKVAGSGGITFSDGSVQAVAFEGVVCGGDYADSVDVSGERKRYEPGDVLVITSDAKGDVAKSQEAYSTLVAGIYSTKPGVVGRRQPGKVKDSTTEIPMAMVGIVPTKVSAENGPISRGDLLVTASIPGYAMKGTDRTKMLGAVVGKAMGSLAEGSGVIEVLVTLQ